MSKEIQLSRRQFLMAGVAGAGSLILPNMAQASLWSNISFVLSLQPVRFIAGLVFNIAKAVIVSLASDYIVAQLSGRHYSSREAYRQFGASVRTASSRALSQESSFQYVPYKASVITLGVADYEYKPKTSRKFQLELLDKPQHQQFANVVHYLRDEKIQIKLADAEFERPAGAYLEPDDLFTLERWTMGKHEEAHFKNLIALTQSSAFKSLSV